MNDALGSYQEKSAPIGFVYAAALVVVASFALLFRSDFTSHLIGYALGSAGCAGLVAVFMRVDAKRRRAEHVVYLENRQVRWAWSVVLLLGIGACALHAWPVATELAVR